MKNREKFREEIVRLLENDDILNEKMCRFVRDNVIPKFISEDNREQCRCGTLSCAVCSKIFAFWLDEEYIEPPKPKVDWCKVPVDTLVQVRDDESDKWALRYFKWFVRGHRTPFVTWADGATSKTAENCTEYWKYCELVEDEEDGSN